MVATVGHCWVATDHFLLGYLLGFRLLLLEHCYCRLLIGCSGSMQGHSLEVLVC